MTPSILTFLRRVEAAERVKTPRDRITTPILEEHDDGEVTVHKPWGAEAARWIAEYESYKGLYEIFLDSTITQAVAEEREACARVADTEHEKPEWDMVPKAEWVGNSIARRIRARSNGGK